MKKRPYKSPTIRSRPIETQQVADDRYESIKQELQKLVTQRNMYRAQRDELRQELRDISDKLMGRDP